MAEVGDAVGIRFEFLDNGSVVDEVRLDGGVWALRAVELVVVKGGDGGEIIGVEAGVKGTREIGSRGYGARGEVEDFEDSRRAGEIKGLGNISLDHVRGGGNGGVSVALTAGFVTDRDGGETVGAEIGVGIANIVECVGQVEGHIQRGLEGHVCIGESTEACEIRWAKDINARRASGTALGLRITGRVRFLIWVEEEAVTFG